MPLGSLAMAGSTGVLSPMHDTTAAVQPSQTPRNDAGSAVPSSTKKTNVFGKLLSGGKKMLSTKRTPVKSAVKLPEKVSAAQSASRPRGSLAPGDNSSGGRSTSVRHISPVSYEPSRDLRSEAVDNTTCNVGVPATFSPATLFDSALVGAMTDDTSDCGAEPCGTGAPLDEFDREEQPSTSAPEDVDVNSVQPATSPHASATAPESPVKPTMQLTAADILSDVQAAGDLKLSTSAPVECNERPLETSSPPTAPVVSVSTTVPSPVVLQKQASSAPPKMSSPPKVNSSASCSGGALSAKQGGPAKPTISVKQQTALKPSSHAAKLEEIRQKQKAANLQKDRERQEREAEREQRIQAQKERAMKEKIIMKQALKQKAEKTLEGYHGGASAPTAPVLAPATVSAVEKAAPSAPQPLQAHPEASSSLEIPASVHLSAEVEAQQRADLAARQAAADEYDSYCMSEPEEQEQDYSDEDEQRGKAPKRVPSWANKDSLRAALKQQAELKIDPDAIFFECNTCSLEEIFERTSKRSVSSKRADNRSNTISNRIDV